MFTSSEIKNIISKSSEDMKNLLNALNISLQVLCSSSETDTAITNEVCRLMKSESIPEGYSFLLRAGGIPLDFSETPNERLAKVVAHRQIIEPAIIKQENISASPQYETRFKVSPLYSPNTGKQDLNWERSSYFSQEAVTTRQEFRAQVQNLREITEHLPDTVDTVNTLEGDIDTSPRYSESELIEFLKRQNEGTYFVVSRCRVKCNAPKPDSSKKFTVQEAALMFDILEKINDLVSKI